MLKFPNYIQLDSMDCGPTCLKIVAKYYGKSYSLEYLRERSYITREGVSMLGLSEAAESVGFRTIGVRLSFEQLVNEVQYPCIIHWNQQHFIVVYKIKKRKNESYTIYVSDPAAGLLKYSKEEFLNCWENTKAEGKAQGISLLLEPTEDFYKQDGEKINKTGFKFLFSYLRPHYKLLVQLILGMLIGSVLQLVFPFLTQSIVDFGINNSNLNFINLVLIAQLILIVSRTSVEFIRGWILLHIGTRINISLISDFLIKLMKLPVSFFDTKMIGDLIQRIGDHKRIEMFLTSSTLNILFSMFNMLIFGIILAFYSFSIFAVFIIGSILYFLWVYIFMKKRRELDNKRFAQMANSQSNIIQLITGMQEIKLNNCEKHKRWEWERIQAMLFKVNVKSLSLNQYQQAGALFFNESKNILVSFIAAASVIRGDMTLGMMLAVQYIIGQLNSPINQMIGFIHSMQDAKISLERLGEIHQKKNEDNQFEKVTIIPSNQDIRIVNLSFQYEGPNSEYVLKNINVIIPENKITAIVGTSGSGKTTLVKLLLNFYELKNGEIKLGQIKLNHIDNRLWRKNCGVVMQDGFIFSDSIVNNIAVGDEIIDRQKLLYAVNTANIKDFIESLPLGYNTKIGNDGHGISQGQRQRILIARAVYKNPQFLFFDEATNALDANNELTIMKNLNKFFKDKTVVIVAHRLSTVKNADQIIVIEKGEIIETGNHNELTKKKGAYYNLVKNQLELGN